MAESYIEPLTITAGDTLRFIKILPDFTADQGWQLTYSARANGKSPIDFSATASGKDHLVNVAPTGTDWTPGQYRIQGYVTNQTTGEKRTIYGEKEPAFLTVAPNLSAMSEDVPDMRSHNRKVLDAVQAAIEDHAKTGIVASNIEGTQVTCYTINDLLLLKQVYSANVRAEEEKARTSQGRATGRRILARFIRR